MTFRGDLNKYVLCESHFLCFPDRAVVNAQNKGNLVSGFAHSCHVSIGPQCGGIASCFLAPLYPHVCFHVRYNGGTSFLSVVWVSHINHSRIYILLFFFYPSDFLSFFHRSVIFLLPHRAACPPWLKHSFYRKHVRNVQQSHFLCTVLP